MKFHRAEYRLNIGENYTPEQLVFVDGECMRSKDIPAEQGMGTRRAPRVPQAILCAREAVCFCHILLRARRLIFDRRYSILPAITMGGIIECTIIEGSFDTQLFFQFIKDLVSKMMPFPGPNSVVVHGQLQDSQGARNSRIYRGAGELLYISSCRHTNPCPAD